MKVNCKTFFGKFPSFVTSVTSPKSKKSGKKQEQMYLVGCSMIFLWIYIVAFALKIANCLRVQMIKTC